jgi:type I restriction enzyme, S subunit
MKSDNRDTLPIGWAYVQLKDIADLVLGKMLDRAKNISGRLYPYLRNLNVRWGSFQLDDLLEMPFEDGELERYGIRAGDVLICEGGEPGRAAVWPGSDRFIMFQKALHRVRTTPALDPHWLVYHLRNDADEGRLEQYFTGTTIKHFTGAALSRYPVVLPPIIEQRRIVAKLEALLARSRRTKEALERVPALLEKLRQSVLAAAFRGDLTADWRARNPDVEPLPKVLERLPPRTSAKRRPVAEATPVQGRYAICVGSPQKPAPQGWTWLQLTDIARLETGHTPSRSLPEYWDGDIPWVGIKDAREHHGCVIYKTHQTITQAGLDNSAARLLPQNTVCLSRTASVGYVFILGRSMATSQDFVCWVCSEAVVPKFLMYLLMAEGQDVRRFGKGTTHTTIYFPEVMAFHVCIPSIAEQKQIVLEIEKRFETVSRIQSSWQNAVQSMQHIDEAILSKAFCGELVPQDPNDEPASVLLERLRAEREAGAPKRSRGRPSAA